MVNAKKIGMVAAPLVLAIGIGTVMQSSETAQQRYGHAGGSDAHTDATMHSNALLDVQKIKLTSGELNSGITTSAPDAQVIKTAAPASTLAQPDLPRAPLAEATPPRDCAMQAEARAKAAAMVELTLAAPCAPNERLTVHHNGMIFTETTDASGNVALTVPALATEAVFIMAFVNGDGAVAQTTVDGLEDYARAVLQWKGEAGFQIHAREFGAPYGDPGHLWADNPGAIADAVLGESGFLTRHGDTDAADPLLAEVYTFPKNATQRSGDVALTVETEISTANCGLEIEAQSLELGAAGKVKTQNLNLSVPDCDAAGSFLVLNNLLADLKVAAR